MKTIRIDQLKSGEESVIDFITNRLSKKWKLTPSQVRQQWIDPALSDAAIPCAFIARMDGMFVGKIFLYIEDDGYCSIKSQPWITALFVPQNFRGQAIGRKLIRHVKEYAQKQGYRNIYLDTASSSGYYDKIGGWERVGVGFWEAGQQEVVVMKSSVSLI